MKPEITVFIPVCAEDIEIAKISISYLLRNSLTKINQIIVATNTNEAMILENVSNQVKVFDEKQLFKHLTIADVIQKTQESFQDTKRAGWYYQQFIKMEFCKTELAGEYYLIWDADTILLNKHNFFDSDNKTVMGWCEDRNEAYKRTYNKLFPDYKWNDKSFIVEHQIINTKHMRSLLEEINAINPAIQHWHQIILDSINKDDYQAGFSEYETYANYVTSRYPESVSIKKIKSDRWGAKRFGRNPSEHDLYVLSRKYVYVSFEKWNCGKAVDVLRSKFLAWARYLRDHLTLGAQPY